MAPDQPEVGDAERARRLDVVELAQLEGLAAHDPAEAHPAGDAHRDAHLHRTAPHRHDQRDQQQQVGNRHQDRHHEEGGVVDAAPEVAGAHADEQRERDHDQAGEAADQQRDARSVERQVQHVASQDVGSEQVPAGMLERVAAVELDGGERRGVALLVEVEREGAIDERAGAVLRQHVAARSGVAAAHPRHGIEQRDRQVDRHHEQRDRPAPRELDGRRPPELAAPHADRDREHDREHARDDEVRHDVGFHARYSSRTRGSTSV